MRPAVYNPSFRFTNVIAPNKRNIVPFSRFPILRDGRCCAAHTDRVIYTHARTHAKAICRRRRVFAHPRTHHSQARGVLVTPACRNFNRNSHRDDRSRACRPPRRRFRRTNSNFQLLQTSSDPGFNYCKRQCSPRRIRDSTCDAT